MLISKNYGVSSAIMSTTGCELIRVQGYFTGDGETDRWLQIHDSATVPANTAVPLKSYALPVASAFSWSFDPGRLTLVNGCTVVISSTEATLTASEDEGDIFGEVEPTSFTPQNYSVGGDLSTGVDSLTVWANPTEAVSPNVLHRFTYVNNDGAARYLMLFANNESADGDKPILQWKVANGATLVLNFGRNGLSPMVINAGVLYRGCYFAQSSTTGTLTITSTTASYMMAYYV